MSTVDFEARLARGIARRKIEGGTPPNTLPIGTRIAYVGSQPHYHGLGTVVRCYAHPVDGSTRYALRMDTEVPLVNVNPSSIRVLTPVTA